MLRAHMDLDAALLMRNLSELDPKVQRAIEKTLKHHEPRLEAHMKANAPWTDRTTLARNTLYARVSDAGGGWDIELGGGAPYQIYLEKKYGGRDAIIEPTLASQGPVVMATLARILDRL